MWLQVKKVDSWSTCSISIKMIDRIARVQVISDVPPWKIQINKDYQEKERSEKLLEMEKSWDKSR